MPVLLPDDGGRRPFANPVVDHSSQPDIAHPMHTVQQHRLALPPVDNSPQLTSRPWASHPCRFHRTEPTCTDHPQAHQHTNKPTTYTRTHNLCWLDMLWNAHR